MTRSLSVSKISEKWARSLFERSDQTKREHRFLDTATKVIHFLGPCTKLYIHFTLGGTGFWAWSSTTAVCILVQGADFWPHRSRFLRMECTDMWTILQGLWRLCHVTISKVVHYVAVAWSGLSQAEHKYCTALMACVPLLDTLWIFEVSCIRSSLINYIWWILTLKSKAQNVFHSNRQPRNILDTLISTNFYGMHRF